MAKLLFLGRLEDRAGTAEITIPLRSPTPLAEVLAGLPADLAAALTAPNVRLAHNGALATADGLVLAPGDELAFLPPVSGG